MKTSAVRIPAQLSVFPFPISHSAESPEELILRPILLPIKGDIISYVVISIWVSGLILIGAAIVTWFHNHQHRFITMLQSFDKHKHLKKMNRGPHKGEYKQVGSAVGGVLALLSYAFSALGIIFICILLSNYHKLTLDTRETACHITGGESLNAPSTSVGGGHNEPSPSAATSPVHHKRSEGHEGGSSGETASHEQCPGLEGTLLSASIMGGEGLTLCDRRAQ